MPGPLKIQTEQTDEVLDQLIHKMEHHLDQLDTMIREREAHGVYAPCADGSEMPAVKCVSSPVLPGSEEKSQPKAA